MADTAFSTVGWPRCAEHDTSLAWADGTELVGYAEGFRPFGFYCPCDPGHPVVTGSQADRRPHPDVMGSSAHSDGSSRG